MSLRDRISVEPLSDDRLDRIEQRIVYAAPAALARPARPALWPWALAASTAAAAALAVVALQRPAPAPAAPVAVATDGRGTSIDLGDAVVAVGPDTRFRVTRPGGGLDVELDGGVVTLDVAPRRGRPPLWVRAGDVGVRVVGTAFSVRRDLTLARVEVAVEHGVVEVHRGGTVRPVRAGERWASDDDAVITAVAPPPPATEAGVGAGAGVDGAGTIGDHPRTDTTLATGPAVDVAVLDGRRSPVAPPSGDSAGGAHRASGSTGPTSEGARTSTPRAKPVGDLRADIMKQPLAPAMATTAATPAEAADEYQRKALAGRGAEASAALYALAYTQHLRLGKHGDAVKNLDAYLRRFPSGPELEAVLWLRLRALCQRQIDEPCRAAAHTYATRYPGDEGPSGVADRVTKSR